MNESTEQRISVSRNRRMSRTVRSCLGRIGVFLALLMAMVVILVLVNYLFFIQEYRAWKSHPDPSGKLVQIDNAKLFYRIRGSGSPLIIIESGLGTSYTRWEPLQDSLSSYGTVVIYDRGDYGFSETKNYPRTSEVISQELAELLKAEQLSGPVILIGHSFGANQIIHHALTLPNPIQALILIDPGPYNFDQTMDNLSQDSRLSGAGRKFIKGLIENNDLFVMKIPGELGLIYRLYRIETHPVDENYTSVMNWSSSRYYKALASEIGNSRTAFSEAERQKLSNVPLILITANHLKIQEEVVRQVGKTDAEILVSGYYQGQLQYLSLSPSSRYIEASTGEHNVYLVEPELIISAVESVLK